MNVAIIGSGLIGGSIGLSLKMRLPQARVIAFDIEGSAAERAVGRGAADEARPSIRSAVEDAEVVFVCTPVRAIAQVVTEAFAAGRADAVITDVGSTKARVMVEVAEAAPDLRTFVGGHPMAGSEHEGIDSAHGDLLLGAWWILTPAHGTDEAAVARLTALLTTLGVRVATMDPAEHDELMAVISHLPQLLSSSLMDFAAGATAHNTEALRLAAGGFRDLTRVAASNPALWIDICRDNHVPISRALATFAERLHLLSEQVRRLDEQALREMLERARRARRSLPGKALAGEPHVVRVLMPDRPGALAQVTAAIGEAGLNIEDLEIVHSTEGGHGRLRLTLDGADAAAAAARALVAWGFDARVGA